MRANLTRPIGITVIAVMLLACNGDAEADPTPDPVLSVEVPTATFVPTPDATPTPSPTPTAPATPTPATAAPPTADPAELANVTDDGEVTIAEAQAIIDAQLAIYNPPVIAMLSTPDESLPPLIPGDVASALLSIYYDGVADIFIDNWNRVLGDDLQGYRRADATGYAEEVVEVVASTDDCISLRVELDFRGVVRAAEDPSVSHMEFLKDEDNPPRNPTRWVRNYIAVDPPNPELSCL